MSEEMPLMDSYPLEFEVTIYQLLLLLDIENGSGSWELLKDHLFPDGVVPEAQKQFTQVACTTENGIGSYGQRRRKIDTAGSGCRRVVQAGAGEILAPRDLTDLRL